MAALVFFTSLFLLAALLSLTAVSGLFAGSRRSSKNKSGAKTGQAATRKARQKRQPPQAGGAAKARRAAGSKPDKTATPRSRLRLRLPNIPVPPGLLSCLPLGLLFALMAGAGQLALYGLQQSRGATAEDPRLVAFDGALDYLGMAALALVVLGLVGAIAGHRRKS